MPASSGISVKVAVSTDGITYNDLAGQRNGTLTINADKTESTTKNSVDVNGTLWEEDIQGKVNWSVAVDGIVTDEADTALTAVETALLQSSDLYGRFTTPGGSTWSGKVIVTSLEYSGPYNDVYSYSITLEGAGALAKA